METFRNAIGPACPSRGGVAPVDDGACAPLSIAGRFPTLKEAEEFLVSEALKRSRDNQGIAAQLLGITRQAMNKRLVRGAKKAKKAP